MATFNFVGVARHATYTVELQLFSADKEALQNPLSQFGNMW